MQTAKDTILMLNAELLTLGVFRQVLEAIGYFREPSLTVDEVFQQGFFVLKARIVDFDHHFGPTIFLQAKNGPVTLTFQWHYLMCVADLPGGDGTRQLGFV
jgi:hypothetical protein